MARVGLLDHGYIETIDVWGSDERIIEAARMSTSKGFLGWGGDPCPACMEAGRLSPNDQLFKTYEDSERARELKCPCGGKGRTIGDEKLLAFLWQNAHQTPFEMAGLTIEVQAPIMVFREWHRHRIPFGYNELSARYTPLPDVNYVPSVERLMMGAKPTTNKQAGAVAGAAVLTDAVAIEWLKRLEDVYILAEAVYQRGLMDGVPKELARLCSPVGRYSRMRATGNLRGWLAFLKLRAASSAQWEIRQFAWAVDAIIKEHFPRTWEVARSGET